MLGVWTAGIWRIGIGVDYALRIVHRLLERRHGGEIGLFRALFDGDSDPGAGDCRARSGLKPAGFVQLCERRYGRSDNIELSRGHVFFDIGGVGRRNRYVIAGLALKILGKAAHCGLQRTCGEHFHFGRVCHRDRTKQRNARSRHARAYRSAHLYSSHQDRAKVVSGGRRRNRVT